MATFKDETVKQRKQIYQLEKERERYGVEAAEQRNLCARRVLTCCLRLVARNDGRGWFLIRFRGRSDRVETRRPRDGSKSTKRPATARSPPDAIAATQHTMRRAGTRRASRK